MKKLNKFTLKVLSLLVAVMLVSNQSVFARYMNVTQNNTIAPGFEVWQIYYPSEGATVAGQTWPELAVETEPASHNVTHTERNYWYVTEKAPSWAVESYSNANAKAPGVVSNTHYEGTKWHSYSVSNYSASLAEIRSINDMAYMSVFTPGGEIDNSPNIIVNGVKQWVDFENDFE